MVTVSRNTASSLLIGSKVIRDRVSEGSVRVVNGSSDPRSDPTRTTSSPKQTRNKVNYKNIGI